MRKVDCEITKAVIWRSVPRDDAVFDEPIGSGVRIDSGQLVKDWRPNEGLLWEGDLIRDVLELRRVVVEVADPDNHRDCLPLLGPEHRAGDLGVFIHHSAGDPGEAAFMRRRHETGI